MKIVGVIFFALIFVKCAGLKLEENPPFKITEATHTNFVGGMPGSGGTNVTFYLEASSTVVFDSIYFNGRKTKTQLKKDKKGNFLLGKFYVLQNTPKADIQLHKDVTKEYGNKPPIPKETIPFYLKENEAIISYKEGENTKYFKVENLKKGRSILMQ